MDATELLAELKQEGLTVSAQGDRLIVESIAGITLSQKALLSEYKPELLKLLAQETANEPPTLPDTTEQPDKRRPTTDHAPSGVAGLFVEVFTPLGRKLIVKANSPAHAEWLTRMNPQPNPAELAARRAAKPGVVGLRPLIHCIDCQQATPTHHPALTDCLAQVPSPASCGPYRRWSTDAHHCQHYKVNKP